MGHGSVSNEIKGRRGADKALEANRSLRKITEEGATFRSYYDGTIKMLTPELSIITQRELGADIILTLDECTAYHVEKKYTEDSMERSHRWELRSLAEFIRGDDGTQVGHHHVDHSVFLCSRQVLVH